MRGQEDLAGTRRPRHGRRGPRASATASRVLGIDGHHGGQHREAFARRQGLVTPAPVGRLTLDALAVGEVPACVARPMHPVGREVEPHDLGPHLGLGRQRPCSARLRQPASISS